MPDSDLRDRLRRRREQGLSLLAPGPAPLRPRPDFLPPPVATEDRLERELCEIWQAELGIDSIGVDDDYFDIGGDSLSALAITETVRRHLNVEIQPSVFIEAPTVRRLARALRTDGARQGLGLITVQPGGDRVPSVFIHGIGGEVIFVRDIALRLGADWPVHAIYYDRAALDADGEPESTTRMAARYADLIEHHVADGPVVLAGFSLGGIVALEIAQRLVARGRPVPQLFVIDAIAPHLHTRRRDVVALARHLRYLGFTEALAKLGDLARFYAYAGIARVTGRYVRRLAKRDEELWMFNPLAVALREKVRRGLDAPYNGDVVLITSAENRARYPQYAFGWDRWITGRIEVVDAPGDHLDLIRIPDLGDYLRAPLRRADAAISAATR